MIEDGRGNGPMRFNLQTSLSAAYLSVRGIPNRFPSLVTGKPIHRPDTIDNSSVTPPWLSKRSLDDLKEYMLRL